VSEDNLLCALELLVLVRYTDTISSHRIGTFAMNSECNIITRAKHWTRTVRVRQPRDEIDSERTIKPKGGKQDNSNDRRVFDEIYAYTMKRNETMGIQVRYETLRDERPDELRIPSRALIRCLRKFTIMSLV